MTRIKLPCLEFFIWGIFLQSCQLVSSQNNNCSCSLGGSWSDSYQEEIILIHERNERTFQVRNVQGRHWQQAQGVVLSNVECASSTVICCQEYKLSVNGQEFEGYGTDCKNMVWKSVNEKWTFTEPGEEIPRVTYIPTLAPSSTPNIKTSTPNIISTLRPPTGSPTTRAPTPTQTLPTTPKPTHSSYTPAPTRPHTPQSTPTPSTSTPNPNTAQPRPTATPSGAPTPNPTVYSALAETWYDTRTFHAFSLSQEGGDITVHRKPCFNECTYNGTIFLDKIVLNLDGNNSSGSFSKNMTKITWTNGESWVSSFSLAFPSIWFDGIDGGQINVTINDIDKSVLAIKLGGDVEWWSVSRGWYHISEAGPPLEVAFGDMMLIGGWHTDQSSGYVDRVLWNNGYQWLLHPPTLEPASAPTPAPTQAPVPIVTITPTLQPKKAQTITSYQSRLMDHLGLTEIQMQFLLSTTTDTCALLESKWNLSECIVSEWSDWSACVSSGSGNTSWRSRTRSLISKAAHVPMEDCPRLIEKELCDLCQMHVQHAVKLSVDEMIYLYSVV